MPEPPKEQQVEAASGRIHTVRNTVLKSTKLRRFLGTPSISIARDQSLCVSMKLGFTIGAEKLDAVELQGPEALVKFLDSQIAEALEAAFAEWTAYGVK